MFENFGIFSNQQKHLMVLFKMKVKHFKLNRNLMIGEYDRSVCK